MDPTDNRPDASTVKKDKPHHLWLFEILALLLITTGIVVGTVWRHHHDHKLASQPTAPQVSTPQTPPPPPSYVDRVLDGMSLRDKVANLLILHTPGTDPAKLTTYVTTYKPAGLIFMGDNMPDTLAELKAQTDRLVTDKQLPPFIATDEEGDTVKRLGADNFPGALTLRNQPPGAAQDAFSKRSDLLKSVGINLNFGIVADVTADPNSFIYPRVLGTTPQASSERVAAAVKGSEGKTLSTLKHFPGHGETGADSHKSIPTTPTTYNDWRGRVALSFKAGIDAGADLVMFGHLRYSAVDSQPATLSKKWHDIIRNDLGFKGLTITDDMIMLQNSGEAAFTDPLQNAIAALAAGNDLLLYVLDHEDDDSSIDPNSIINGLVTAINDGRIDANSIDERVRKVLTVRHKLGDS